MKKSRLATTKLWAGVAVLLLGSSILAACGDNTSLVVPAATTAPATTAPTTQACSPCTPPRHIVTSTPGLVETIAPGQTELSPFTMPSIKSVALDRSVEAEFAKTYPRFKNPAIRAYVAPQDSKTLFRQTLDSFTKAGYTTDNKFYGKDNLFARPTDQLDTGDSRFAYPGRPDVALGVTSLERKPESIASVLNVPGFNAVVIGKLSEQFKGQKSILLLVFADNLFGDKPTPGPTTPKPPGTPGLPTPTPSPRFTPTDIVIDVPTTPTGPIAAFQMPKLDILTEINASATVRNNLLKSFPTQNVTLRLYGSRNDAPLTATTLDRALKQNGFEFAVNGYQELSKYGEGDKTSLVGIYRHASQEGVLFAVVNLPADRSQLAKHLNLNDLNASDEALLRSQLSGYSSFLAVISSPDIVRIANGSLNLPTPTGSPNTYPK